MTYENMLLEALDKVPAFREKYQYAITNQILDKSDGMHIVFGMTYLPLVVDSIMNTRDQDVLNFLEEMAGSNDHRVQEVCDQSILEALVGECPEDAILSCLDSNTLEGYSAVREYIG